MENKKILVVDDEYQITRVLKRSLQAHRYDVRTASDGESALDTFHDFHPDLVITDLQMPEMNGIEATAAIRGLEAEGSSHVPIVGVTAHALKGDRERCLDAGMDDYLPKPISPKALLDKIDKWTRFDPVRQRSAG